MLFFKLDGFTLHYFDKICSLWFYFKTSTGHFFSIDFISESLFNSYLCEYKLDLGDNSFLGPIFGLIG